MLFRSLNSVVKNDKHLKKHKTELYKFSTDDEFDIDGYMFTNITNSEVPKTTAYSELKEFNLPSIVLVQGEVFTKEILTNTISGAHILLHHPSWRMLTTGTAVSLAF